MFAKMSWLMSLLYVSYLVVVFVDASKKSSKLHMTVFYESLCPDSIDFFKNQFEPNWLDFYSNLNITLVPYGNANTTYKKGKYSFTCQHGGEECENNRIQACAIYREKKRPRSLYSFISCYMSSKKQDVNGPKCAEDNGISFRNLRKCSSKGKGNELLAYWGNVTHNFQPKITWIPTIVFDDKYNKTENERAASDLKSLLCEKLKNKPDVCESESQAFRSPYDQQ